MNSHHNGNEYSNTPDSPTEKTTLPELISIFLRLGATSFGGPLAHIALMQQEFVEKRRWFSQQDFLDMMGATNLVPGPNSTELAMHVGHRRGGVAGLVAAGIAFILPAMLIMLGLAAFYMRFGNVPQLQGPLHGLNAVVVAIVAHALWKFAQSALKNRLAQVAAVASLLLMILVQNELAVLFGVALCGLFIGAWNHRTSTRTHGKTLPAVFLVGGAGWSLGATPTVGNLFLIFLKIGSILYGSGYVLLAFLRQDFVTRGWITDQQLLDAVAFGQFTPGPLFTTATFIGYLLGGVGGGIAATVGIFLPSFFFVAALSWVLDRRKDSPVLRAFLDCVNAASLALMAVVTTQLGVSSLQSPLLLTLSLASLVMLLTTKINSVWLLLVGALLGFVLQL